MLRAIGRYLRQVGVDLQPDLPRPGAERERRPRPAAGRPVRDPVRSRPRRSIEHAGQPGRRSWSDKIKTGAERRGQPRSRPDHPLVPGGDLGRGPDQLLPVRTARRIAFKLLPRQIPDLPEPRPAFEIFVYSPRVEGVHLRFGPVARGGLRWSDRAEDFRTEILGLVKAQMVKNTVIVPVGAKGGFYAKRLPDPERRPRGLAGRGRGLLPAVHHQPARRDRQHRRRARWCRRPT